MPAIIVSGHGVRKFLLALLFMVSVLAPCPAQLGEWIKAAEQPVSAGGEKIAYSKYEHVDFSKRIRAEMALTMMINRLAKNPGLQKYFAGVTLPRPSFRMTNTQRSYGWIWEWHCSKGVERGRRRDDNGCQQIWPRINQDDGIFLTLFILHGSGGGKISWKNTIEAGDLRIGYTVITQDDKNEKLVEILNDLSEAAKQFLLQSLCNNLTELP